MSTDSFRCPGCGEELPEVGDLIQYEGTSCSNCGQKIHAGDILAQISLKDGRYMNDNGMNQK